MCLHFAFCTEPVLTTLSLQSGVKWAKCIPAVRQNSAKIVPDKEAPPPRGTQQSAVRSLCFTVTISSFDLWGCMTLLMYEE